MRNQFPGICAECNQSVKIGEGFFEKIRYEARSLYGPKWKVRCINCVVKRKIQRGYAVADMPLAQRSIAKKLLEKSKVEEDGRKIRI